MRQPGAISRRNKLALPLAAMLEAEFAMPPGRCARWALCLVDRWCEVEFLDDQRRRVALLKSGPEAASIEWAPIAADLPVHDLPNALVRFRLPQGGLPSQRTVKRLAAHVRRLKAFTSEAPGEGGSERSEEWVRLAERRLDQTLLHCGFLANNKLISDGLFALLLERDWPASVLERLRLFASLLRGERHGTAGEASLKYTPAEVEAARFILARLS